MSTTPGLPGLRPPKRHIVIRAQEGWRFLQPDVRGKFNFSEIAELLADAGIAQDLDEATWLVVRAFERRQLANGEARLVHDGREAIFLPEDFIPAKKQRLEGSPDYIPGGAREFTWDSATRLRQDLLDFLYAPLDAVEQWYVRLGWPWDGPRAMSPATEAPSPPALPAVVEKRDTRSSRKGGRRPDVRQAACDCMLDLLRRNVITPEQLSSEKKAVLPTLYGLNGSANTVWKAKHDALNIHKSKRAGPSDHC
jgi:hypothetical protein